MNGTLIPDDERRGAEYDYLKKYAIEWLQVQNDEKRTSFLCEHNRYLELIDSKYENYIIFFLLSNFNYECIRTPLASHASAKVINNVFFKNCVSRNLNFVSYPTTFYY